MRTVSGTITSSKPIRLSKAANSLREFVASPNNKASNAISAFLKRASHSFDELVRFHRHLNKSKHKPIPYQSAFMKSQSGGEDASSNWYVDFREEQSVRVSEVSHGGEEEGSGMSRKKRRRRRASEGEYEYEESEKRKEGKVKDVVELEDSNEVRKNKKKKRRASDGGYKESEKSSERKKRKEREVKSVVELEDSIEVRKNKKKKRRHGVDS
ncbi:hypothetical protein Syun_001294 [Stephania yunnanensis]|uniref:Uncharacterized protein n=1 Tax=Stephania yunnanensis TaxID=152371 RepID=A0AAP0LHI9_9MAGN